MLKHVKAISERSQDTEDLAIQMMLRASDAGSQARQQCVLRCRPHCQSFHLVSQGMDNLLRSLDEA